MTQLSFRKQYNTYFRWHFLYFQQLHNTEMEGQNEEEQQNHQDHLPDLIELIFIKVYDTKSLCLCL
jgi:hypothetical protein